MHIAQQPIIADSLYTFLQENEAHYCLQFKKTLRTMPASAEKQNLKFLI